MAHFDVNNYRFQLLFPEIQNNGETKYIYLVYPAVPISGNLPLGVAVLFEPGGNCAVTTGSFPLDAYVEYATGKSDAICATSYTSVPDADISPFRDKLRDIYSKSTSVSNADFLENV